MLAKIRRWLISRENEKVKQGLYNISSMVFPRPNPFHRHCMHSWEISKARIQVNQMGFLLWLRIL